MADAPVFSIIVPVFKVEEYLPKCVESVLTQTFPLFELILVDDGSPDNCPKLCDEYAKRDERIKVIHKDNGGLSSARNEGMRIAKGEYISFLDSDDFWIRDSVLENLYRIISKEHPEVIVLKSISFFQGSDTFSNRCNPFMVSDFSSDDYETRLLELASAGAYRSNAWNKVFLRELMERRDLFFTEGIVAEDIDWAARLSLTANSITILSEPAHAYRAGRQGSITGSLKLKNLVDTKESIERCIHYLDNVQISDQLKKAYFTDVAYRYVIWMAESLLLSDPGKKPLIKEMKEYDWLLKYDGRKRVSIVKKLYPILGFHLTSALLGLFLKYQKKRRAKHGSFSNNLYSDI